MQNNAISAACGVLAAPGPAPMHAWAPCLAVGRSSGGMDGVARKPLTVAFHEAGVASQLAAENQQPFWFERSSEERGKVGSPWGPVNPQALNRYAYVQNNPLRWTDPSGHDTRCGTPGCGNIIYNWLMRH